MEKYDKNKSFIDKYAINAKEVLRIIEQEKKRKKEKEQGEKTNDER